MARNLVSAVPSPGPWTGGSANQHSMAFYMQAVTWKGWLFHVKGGPQDAGGTAGYPTSGVPPPVCARNTPISLRTH